MISPTKEEVIASARLFNRLSHWEKVDRRAVSVARMNGWLIEVTSHMQPVRRIAMPHRLTDEAIRVAFASCKTKSEVVKKFWRHYQAARSRGLFNEFSAHLPARAPKPVIYSDEDILAAARTCETRTEFREKHLKLWYAATTRKGDLYQRATRHMRYMLNPTVTGINIYAYEFTDNHAYVGLTFDTLTRNAKHQYSGPVHDYSVLSGLPVPEMKILISSVPPAEAPELEDWWREQYAERGWTMLNTAKCGSLGSVNHLRNSRPRVYGPNQSVHLVIGASGAGKSWLCNQLEDVHYVKFDRLPGKHADGKALRVGNAIEAATWQPKPIIFDPTAQVSTVLKNHSRLKFVIGCIIETPEVIKARLEGRGGRMTPGIYRRIDRIAVISRLRGNFSGTSTEVLAWLRSQLHERLVVHGHLSCS